MITKLEILEDFWENFPQYEEMTPTYEDIIFEEEELTEWNKSWMETIKNYIHNYVEYDAETIKDLEEINLMREASRINDLVVEKVITEIKDGISEKFILNRLGELYEENKAEGFSFEPIVAFGEKTSFEDALAIVKTFITTEFSNLEKHQRRIDKITAYEENN